MKRKVFKDENLEKTFLENGYIKLSFLDENEVQRINTFYQENQTINTTAGFHSTHFSKDKSYKSKVHFFLKEYFLVRSNQLFDGYKILFCNFMVKEPGENSIMPLHLDWTYVDESKYISLAIWCTLSDTNEKNGALGLIPKSQNLVHNLRGPKIESPFHSFNEEIIAKAGKLLFLKAGEGIVYNHKTMHYSPPNLSDQSRLAVNIVLVPDEVEINHYCILKDPSIIHSFSNVDEQFFINYDAFEQPPHQYPEKIISNPFVKWDSAILSIILPDLAQNSQKSIWHKLLTIFRLK